jgi:hypothetical protein
MKIPFLVGAAVGYVLGARAGRERYESIVRFARRVAGSQTVQSTAGVLQAQVGDLTAKARSIVADKLPGNLASKLPKVAPSASRVNGVSAQHQNR